MLDGEFGVEAAAGLELGSGRLTVGLRPGMLALVPGAAEPGYRWERLANGQRRCREAATGRFAPDTRCIELETAVAAASEVTWRATGGERPLELGAGYRVGDGSGPYGTVRWRAVPLGASAWRFRASAGPSLLRLAAGLTLPL